jgi:regulator of protease activity HflC (stomatin/prohibitin superfamily)
MWKTFYIKPNELGLLFRRDHFQKVLLPGWYHRWPLTSWRVDNYAINSPAAQIDNLELLLRNHRAELEQHLLIVKTAFNEVALVKMGQQWVSVDSNQLQAFWRGLVEIEAHIFNLDEDLELPSTFVQQVSGQEIQGLQKWQIPESAIGLLYVQDNFVRPLTPGDYAFWVTNQQVVVHLLSRVTPNPTFPMADVLIEQHPDFVAAYCAVVELDSQSIAIVRHRHKVIDILPPASRRLFWQGVTIEQIDISDQAKLPLALVKEVVAGLPEVRGLGHKLIHQLEVPAQHLGLLSLDGVIQSSLPPGLHAWWAFGRSIKTEVVDLRLQTVEVSGQEILSKDKVTLRLNLTAGYRITDPILAQSLLTDITGFIYKELQFSLRSAVGTKTLDELLEDKTSIDRSITVSMREKIETYGIEVESVGVKDIILPGEIKAILSKVVEAEKSAQANVIRRREETAATRSMLNTAKVMEDNPVALRLKELEVLERIAEKIEKINVNGSLDSILNDLISIKK